MTDPKGGPAPAGPPPATASLIQTKLGVSEVAGIKYFTDSSIQKAVDAALARVPAGTNGVVFELQAQMQGEVTMSVAGRIGDQWTIAAAVDVDVKHVQNAALGVKVAYTWA